MMSDFSSCHYLNYQDFQKVAASKLFLALRHADHAQRRGAVAPNSQITLMVC